MPHVKLTAENFQEVVAEEGKTVMVDFYADWCGPCRMLAPTIEEIADEVDENVIVCKLDVDENEDIAIQYGVMTIPTVIVFKGGELVSKVVGVVSKEELVSMLQ